MILRFDSLAEFAHASEPSTKNATVVRMTPSQFNGNLEVSEVVKRLVQGDTSLVSKAEALLSKIEHQELPCREVSEVVASPFGGRVSIGEWLSDSPTPMRRKLRRTSDIAPLKVYVGIASSGGITASEMQARGVAILALVMKLQQYRPVELCLFTEQNGVDESGSTFIVIQINSTPLDLASSGFGLAHAGVFRQLCMAYAQAKNGYTGSWPRGYCSSTNVYDGFKQKNYQDSRALTLGLAENDIVVESACLTDELIHDPVKWVNNQLRRVGVAIE
jgi:hypothetical protein